MSLTAKSEGGDFKQIPPGNHIAICYAVIDLGTQHNDAISGEWGSQEARDVKEILFLWELPNEMVTFTDKEGVEVTRPAGISFFYTNSLNEKANLRKHLEAWRGKAFTQEELLGFSVAAVLGKPCMLNVVHKPNGKAKITGVAAMPKGIQVPAQTNESLAFDLDEFDQTVFDKVSEGIQGIIKKSAEWKQNQFIETVPQEDPHHGQPSGFRHNPHSSDPAPEDEFDEDSIPF